jgi:hypothetical protein
MCSNWIVKIELKLAAAKYIPKKLENLKYHLFSNHLFYILLSIYMVARKVCQQHQRNEGEVEEKQKN